MGFPPMCVCFLPPPTTALCMYVCVLPPPTMCVCVCAADLCEAGNSWLESEPFSGKQNKQNQTKPTLTQKISASGEEKYQKHVTYQ